MLPTPEIRVWSSSSRFTPAVRRRTRRTKSASSNSGSSGSRAMWAISGGSSAPPSETDSPPNIRWSTNRSSSGRWFRDGAPRSLPRSHPPRPGRARAAPAGAVSSGAPGGWTSICPLMPRWPSRASPLPSGSQKYLPRRRAPTIRCPVSARAKPSGPRGSRRTGRGWSTSTRVTVAPTTWRSRPRADDLDLGELGHGRSGSALSRRRRLDRGHDGRVLDAELGRDLAVRRLRGGLLGLLLGAADAVAVELVGRPGPAR